MLASLDGGRWGLKEQWVHTEGLWVEEMDIMRFGYMEKD